MDTAPLPHVSRQPKHAVPFSKSHVAFHRALLVVAGLLLGILHAISRHSEASVLWRLRDRGTGTGGTESESGRSGNSTAGGEPTEEVLPYVRMVELQVESGSSRVIKVLVPLHPAVAQWWTDVDLVVKPTRPISLTRPPYLDVAISGSRPLEIDGVNFPGIHVVIEMPEGAVLEAGRIDFLRVKANFEPLAALGPIRALFVVCPKRNRGPQSEMANALSALSWRRPLGWLLLPWILLLLPLIVGSSIGPLALLGGVSLTLALIACLSFVIAIMIIILQRRCLLWSRRWRRLWRLKALIRRQSRIGAAFGDRGPCCICLAESDQREKVIALLPCRHALHEECYRSWVRADAYPSHDLICPLCRRRAEAIGKLNP